MSLFSKSHKVDMLTSDMECEKRNDNGGNDSILKFFIETYKELPELWNPADPNYINRHRRNAALDKLLSIFVAIKPGATRFDVRRKINTLRCNYRKELTKIEDSIRSGTGDVYTPTSWVFYALQFINKFEHLSETNDEDNNDVKTENPSLLELTSSASHLSRTMPTMRPLLPLPKKPRLNDPIAQQNEILQKVSTYLEQSTKTSDASNIPTIAKVWGEKLLDLDPQQRALAERAINDVLFEASQGTLNRHSVKINC